MSALSYEEWKVALAILQSSVVAWMKDYGDDFPVLRDMCHAVDEEIDAVRSGNDNDAC